MRPVSPISRQEFFKMLHNCAPPSGLQTAIAVANSGGPDSTCLLFLTSRFVAEQPKASIRPPSVVSLTVDHDLQASSHAMAEQCAKTAASLGVQHLTTRIPWSVPPFPARPSQGEPFERLARDARYHVLFQSMLYLGTKIIAFGHHADDQVETSLMRLGRQTTELGAGGMRKRRRWGMGTGTGPGSLGWAGHDGMDTWILRPLLDVSKDRILATCDENGLEYVNDPTNFQPEITLRNAIRHLLSGGRDQLKVHQAPSSAPMPAEIAEQLLNIETATTQSVPSLGIDISGGREKLRAAVKRLSSRVEHIDRQVDSILEHSRLPSPPGTFLLSTRKLSSVLDGTIRTAFVLRIMRYVSFHPWGSLRADGNRRRSSIQQIVQKLWDQKTPPWERKKFVAGGGALWTPVHISALGQMRLSSPAPQEEWRPVDEQLGSVELAWLASRQPPIHPNKTLKMGLDDPLNLDLTNLLAEKMKMKDSDQRGATTVSVLYDCRFLLRFNLDLVPEVIARSITEPQGDRGSSSVIVRPYSKWYWPDVIWRRAGKEDTILASVVPEGKDHQKRLDTREWSDRADHDNLEVRSEQHQQSTSPWIQIEWVRSLEAA